LIFSIIQAFLEQISLFGFIILYTGIMTGSNLIKSIRLKQAAYLLINNKVNISDVAYKVGFSSHSYFSNMFKDYFGMAPTEFVSKYSGAEEKESFNRLFENN